MIRRITIRFIACGAISLTLSALGYAQEEQRWSLYESFQGSSNTDGQVMKLDSTVTYKVNRHFDAAAGVPLYFVNGSSTSAGTSAFISGIGNAYVDLRLKASGAATFTSTVRAAAPTGDKDKGLSTGRATVDWTNYVALPRRHIMPFGSVGIANTVSDTTFFSRPFTSLGMVGHMEGGVSVPIVPFFSVGGSAYDIVPSGQQTIISKIKGNSSTSQSNPSPSTANQPVIDNTADHGFSTWMQLKKGSNMNFQLGYNRSAVYQLNSVFFSLGFNINGLINNRP
jgi:hypothetical protein